MGKRVAPAVAPNAAPASGPAEDKRARDLLSRLEQAHAALIAALGTYDEITRRPLADRSRYIPARIQTADANFSRRKLVKECVEHLHPIVDAATAGALEARSCANLDSLRRSAAHFARWPTDSIEREWHAYCRASGEIQVLIRAEIEEDRRLLYPLLRSRAGGPGADPGESAH